MQIQKSKSKLNTTRQYKNKIDFEFLKQMSPLYQSGITDTLPQPQNSEPPASIILTFSKDCDKS